MLKPTRAPAAVQFHSVKTRKAQEYGSLRKRLKEYGRGRTSLG